MRRDRGSERSHGRLAVAGQRESPRLRATRGFSADLIRASVHSGHWRERGRVLATQSPAWAAVECRYECGNYFQHGKPCCTSARAGRPPAAWSAAHSPAPACSTSGWPGCSCVASPDGEPRRVAWSASHSPAPRVVGLRLARVFARGQSRRRTQACGQVGCALARPRVVVLRLAHVFARGQPDDEPRRAAWWQRTRPPRRA
ncbi:predicted protein [Streptomyces sp. AA4]|nr:predicted protein [Streptomyces sp. AA4]